MLLDLIKEQQVSEHCSIADNLHDHLEVLDIWLFIYDANVEQKLCEGRGKHSIRNPLIGHPLESDLVDHCGQQLLIHAFAERDIVVVELRDDQRLPKIDIVEILEEQCIFVLEQSLVLNAILLDETVEEVEAVKEWPTDEFLSFLYIL